IFFVLLRGSGDLAVTIDYPEERKGSFSVRLSRHSARVRRRAGTSRARTREAEPPVPVRVSSRLEHTFVTRETHFRSLPARRWFVRVEGTLEADGASAIGQVELEQEIRVERGRVSQACFELCGEEQIEPNVVRDQPPAAAVKSSLDARLATAPGTTSRS